MFGDGIKYICRLCWWFIIDVSDRQQQPHLPLAISLMTACHLTPALLHGPSGVGEAATTKNIHFYDRNLNGDSETVIEDHFLWRIFLFRHRSVVMILQPSLSMMKFGIVTKNVIEEHRVSSQTTRATHLWQSPLILWRTWLRHWTNYTSMTNNINL